MTYKPYREELKTIKVNQVCQAAEGFRKPWHLTISGRRITFDLEGEILKLFVDGNSTGLRWNVVSDPHTGRIQHHELPYGKHVFYILNPDGSRARYLLLYVNGDVWNIGTCQQIKPRYAVNRLSVKQRRKLPETYETRMWDKKFKGNHLRDPWKLKKAIRLDRKDKALELHNARGK
jgi:hypothetical protein